MPVRDRENDKMDGNRQVWINYLSRIYPDLQKPCYNAGEVNKKLPVVNNMPSVAGF